MSKPHSLWLLVAFVVAVSLTFTPLLQRPALGAAFTSSPYSQTEGEGSVPSGAVDEPAPTVLDVPPAQELPVCQEKTLPAPVCEPTVETVRVEEIVPVTQVVLVTETVVVEEIVPVTQIVLVTETVVVEEIVPVTQTVVVTEIQRVEEIVPVTQTVVVTETQRVEEIVPITQTIFVTETERVEEIVPVTQTVVVTEIQRVEEIVPVTQTVIVTETQRIEQIIPVTQTVVVTQTVEQVIPITRSVVVTETLYEIVRLTQTVRSGPPAPMATPAPVATPAPTETKSPTDSEAPSDTQAANEAESWAPHLPYVAHWEQLKPDYWGQTQLPISGLAMYYSPSVMDGVVSYRLSNGNVDRCIECVGYVALLRAGDINRRVWIQLADGTYEGPFQVTDVAARRDIPGLLRRDWAVDVDWGTSRRWGMAGPVPVTILDRPPTEALAISLP